MDDDVAMGNADGEGDESSARQNTWNSLPDELTGQILQELAELQAVQEQILADYAIVCKAWQYHMEAVNFRSLHIKHNELSDFSNIMTPERIRWLERLHFEIKLPKYSKAESREVESERLGEKNDKLFSQGMFDLFQIMSTWTTTEMWKKRLDRGIELELSAASPSDRWLQNGHWRGDLHEERLGGVDLNFDVVLLVQQEEPFGLPMVDGISRFSITRRNHRSISPASLRPILQSLPKLAEVNIESYASLNEFDQHEVAVRLAGELSAWPLQRLKRFSLFDHRDAPELDGYDMLWRNDFLGKVIRCFSTNLEALSACYCITAEAFLHPFHHLPPTPAQLPTWPNLRWLTLTSTAIRPADFVPDDVDSGTVHDLLMSAAAAARRMPALEAMELFNANSMWGGVFRYFCMSEDAVITWTSTWRWIMCEEVKDAWRAVAKRKLKDKNKELTIWPEVKLDGFQGGLEGFLHSQIATRSMVLHEESSKEWMRDRGVPESVLHLKR